MTDDRPRILLVDDEPALLRILSRMLDSEGFRVTAVHSAEDALAWLESAEGSELVVADASIPWAVVSDVRLPTMNGCKLGQEIVTRWPGTRIGFISGYVADDLFERKICPCDLPLLAKPFLPDDFLWWVRHLLAAEPWSPKEGIWPELGDDFP